MCRTGEQQPMHAGGAAYNIHHRMRVRTRSACTIHALLASASEIVTHVWDPPKSIHLRIIYKGARSQRLLPQIATAITTSTHANVMHVRGTPIYRLKMYMGVGVRTCSACTRRS